MLSPRQQRIEELLAIMSAQTADQRTHLIEQIAAEDPELAAHLSLRAPGSEADTEVLATVPLASQSVFRSGSGFPAISDGADSEPAIWGSGLAMLIEAGTEAVDGRMDEAIARWSDAERELTRAGMLLYAAAARYCRGRLSDDPSWLPWPRTSSAIKVSFASLDSQPRWRPAFPASR